MISILTLLLFAFSVAKISSATCVSPTGISDTSNYNPLPPNSPAPNDSIFFTFILASLEEIVRRETPIAFHVIQSIITALFNTMGSFEEKALDIWGQHPPVRFCKDSKNFQLYRSVTLAYISLWMFKDGIPSLSAKFDAISQSWGIDPDICHSSANCDDVTTPWGHAYHRLKEYRSWLSRDGWNRDGSLSRQFNRIPYQDWTANPFIPKNSPWKIKNTRKWQPLLENDGMGFLFHQEHLTPHIGLFGRSFVIDDDTYCSLTARNPRYNYVKELNLLISRSAAMAEDNLKKAKIELFDNKISSLLVLQINFAFARGVSGDSWEFILLDAIVSTTFYESVMLVWKEKIRHNAIRPPTRLRFERFGRKITAYAGPHQGKKRFLAEEWEPYIRTMPHAEYPSGSACFCRVFSKTMNSFFGSDEMKHTNGENFSLPITLHAGSSKVESGMPLSNITLLYSKWSDVAKDCSQSRTDGGMHFTTAVPEAEKLCDPVPELVHNSVTSLANGIRPKFVQQFDKKLMRKMRCGQK